MKHKRTYVPPTAKPVPEHATCVFEGIHTSVWHWEQELFDGSTTTFEVIKRYDIVDVLAVVEDKIIIADEEQPNIGTFVDIPTGGVEFSNPESELVAAQRELYEETGYKLQSWKLIDARQLSSRIDQIFYVFVAYGEYTKSSPQLDAGEKISPRLVPFDEFKTLAPKLRSYTDFRDILDKVSSVDELIALPDLYITEK